LKAHPETSAAVVMDEALEIAKRFSSADSVEFINGILDAIHKSLQASSPQMS
jgi:N utilization substance protein B